MRQTDIIKNGFRLIQDDAFFKAGQDSLLLSEFVKLRSNMKICELGCGNGAIMLLLLARKQNIFIDGLEIQPEVAKLALENISLNNMNNQANIICGDILKTPEYFKSAYYDQVVINPPYFKEGSGKVSLKQSHKIARFEGDLSLEDICSSAKYLLKYGGKLAMVHKPERTADIIIAMNTFGIIPKRMRFVHNTKTSRPSAVLIEGRVGSSSGIIVEPPFKHMDKD